MATIGEVEVSLQTQLRDESGRFISAVQEGAHDAAEELAEKIADQAASNVLSRLRQRTGQLVGSIQAVMVSAYVGNALATAPHAPPQEFGAGPHDIPNSFGWGADYGFGHNRKPPQATFHPGNPAVHFMADAGEHTAAQSASIVRKHMPGM